MTKFTRALYSTTSLGVALALASPASAQTAAPVGPPAPAAAATPEDSSTIVVTGFRAALRSATARKKKAETVVESVSAEDIGKLPDNSIGESIARLPGVAAQRNAGRANIISIRGFGPDFSTTTLNGRQQTTTNDSRAVEFDQYPSEILAGVDVYKTSEADHTAGGLVGSIDLRTIRPLDYGKRVLAVGARGTYVDQKLDPNSKDKGYRAYATYVDQFADGKAGVALSAAYTNEPYQTRDFNAWDYGPYPAGGFGMNGIKTWVETDQLKRLGVNGTIQIKPTEDLSMSFDGFYSKFTDRVDQRGFEMPISYGAGHAVISNTTVNGNGFVTAATVAGTPLIENYANDRVANQYSLGWNTVWNNHQGWQALLDVSWSRTKRKDLSLQTTAGLGRGLPNATGVISYTMTPTGPEFVSNYNGASPNLVLTDVEGWSSSPVQAGYSNERHTTDNLVEARAEIEREVGSFIKSIKVGVDFTHRTKGLTAIEGFLSPPNGADTAAIPANLLLTQVTLDRGLGNIIAYDPRTLVSSGVLSYVGNSYGDTKGYNIKEDALTPYAMASLNGRVGSADLTGNIGVQAIRTDVTSSNQSFLTVKDRYWMVLPSLNLNFRFPNDFIIRFAASKQMMRPRLPDLNNVISVGVDINKNPPVYSGGGGNPLLRPYQAKALDLNFEKYFGSKGYVALQTFYKHMDTYIASGIDPAFDYTSFPKPPGGAIIPPSQIGLLYSNVNTHGGYVYGVEVAGTLPFDVFSQSLSGFGLTGGAGYTKTRVKNYYGQPDVIPGYSKYVASLTAFYEAHGVNVRGSARYRSGYAGDFVLYSGGIQRQPVLAETIYDAQIGYDFQPSSALHGLSLYVQGQNLTDERSATLGLFDNGRTDPLGYLKYQTYGRRFVAGFTYKF